MELLSAPGIGGLKESADRREIITILLSCRPITFIS